jgi:Na+/proline symporter
MNIYIEYLLNHAILTAIFFGVGKVMQRFIGAKSEARREHRRYVFWWMIGSFGIGGALGAFVAPDGPGPGATGFAGFCMLCGWIIGMIHGALMMQIKPAEKPSDTHSSGRVK